MASLKHSLSNRLIYSIGKDPITATHRDWFHTTAYAVRERLIERWMETMRSYYRTDAKRVYYLSMEFLTGRLLVNSLLNMGFYDECREALSDLELDFDRIRELEPDAALGNGGLGRLAACFLDSHGDLGLPGYGYGIRYEYGMFTQRIEDGLPGGAPRQLAALRQSLGFPAARGALPGQVRRTRGAVHGRTGRCTFHWVDTDDVMAMAFDTPVPGYDTTTVEQHAALDGEGLARLQPASTSTRATTSRRWRTRTQSENLSKVLYPDDTTIMGQGTAA